MRFDYSLKIDNFIEKPRFNSPRSERRLAGRRPTGKRLGDGANTDCHMEWGTI